MSCSLSCVVCHESCVFIMCRFMRVLCMSCLVPRVLCTGRGRVWCPCRACLHDEILNEGEAWPTSSYRSLLVLCVTTPTLKTKRHKKSMEKAQYSGVNTRFLCMAPNTLFDKPWRCLFNNDILCLVTQYLRANTLQKPKYPVLTQSDNTEIVCYTKQKHNIFLLTHRKDTVFSC